MKPSLSRMRQLAENFSASLRITMFLTFEIVLFLFFLRELYRFAQK
jgi:hypothetical protein